VIKKESIENLKESLDIVDVVGSYIDLKKSGSGGYKARCPFHDEKTPSFTVNQNRQFFHCFGCGASGNSISFVMDYEGLSFRESVEELAERYSIPLEYEDSSSNSKNEKESREENRLPIFQKLSEWLTERLWNNFEAISYLKGRGFTEKSIRGFQLGYAPSSYETLSFLQGVGVDITVGEELGLIAKNSNGEAYARFTNRVMFPIFSQNGKIIAFGGRTLGNHPAKYINSPATRYFNKSKTLYGFNFAKEHILRQKEVIVVEGYLDLIALHQAGIENVVATLGTALTESHSPLLKRGDSRVVLAFDGDKAGADAAFKASEILLKERVDAYVVLFPDGVDPADMVKSGRVDEVKKLFSSGRVAGEFAINHIVSKFDLSNPIQKERAGKSIGEFLSELPKIMQGEYLNYSAIEVLKVEPHYIPIVSKRSKEKSSSVAILELTLIKTAFENRELCEAILQVDERFFQRSIDHYRDLRKQTDTDRLLKLSTSSSVPTLPSEEFYLELYSYKLFTLLQERREATAVRDQHKIRVLNMDILRTEKLKKEAKQRVLALD
jgi:DNA primase